MDSPFIEPDIIKGTGISVERTPQFITTHSVHAKPQGRFKIGYHHLGTRYTTSQATIKIGGIEAAFHNHAGTHPASCKLSVIISYIREKHILFLHGSAIADSRVESRIIILVVSGYTELEPLLVTFIPAIPVAYADTGSLNRDSMSIAHVLPLK
ncbi:MAG: hypothetical protein ABIJ86_09330 [Spirochaetota bacterium]